MISPTRPGRGATVPSIAQQLWDLQQLDAELDRLRHEVRALQGRLGESEALRVSRARAEQANAELRAAETALRDAELAVGGARDKLTADEKKLYDGPIR